MILSLSKAASEAMRHLSLSVLLLSSTHAWYYPDFGDDSEYWTCDDDYCIQKYIYIRIYDELQVPNKSISFRGAPEWFDVDSESLLKDCAPNLSIRDIATRVKSCKDIERKYKDACEFSKKGWLQANGNVSRENLQTQLQGIEGMNKYIDIYIQTGILK